jgi:RHS repeat-associated protein
VSKRPYSVCRCMPLFVSLILTMLVVAWLPASATSMPENAGYRAPMRTKPDAKAEAHAPEPSVVRQPRIGFAHRVSGLSAFRNLAAARVAEGGNVSGAIDTSLSCFQSTVGGSGTLFSRGFELPFWMNFLGRAYHHVWVSKEGYLSFDLTPTGPGADTAVDPFFDITHHQTAYNNEGRTIAPLYTVGTTTDANGNPTATYGTTTFEGHPAVCAQWIGAMHTDQCISTFPVDPTRTNSVQVLIVNRSDVGFDDFDIVFNYGSIQFDEDGACSDGAGAGWKTAAVGGSSALIDGSWLLGPFLDSDQTSGLIHRSLGSVQLGRFIWNVRNNSAAPHVDPYQTFGLPTSGLNGGAWGTNPTAMQGEPVDSATGNYNTSATDLSLPGIGVAFALTRSYNSGDASNGPLGLGWTHSLNASLSVQANGDVQARAGDGQQLLFTLNPDGTFTPPTGGRSTLAAVSGGYELVTHDQLHFRFDGQGRLLSERDRNGQGLSFSYNPDGTLATIVDSVGRTISFSYDGGMLSQVSLPDGRHVGYGYDGNGRLATVTDARNGITRYTYDPNGLLATIVDQNNHTVVQNTYGADGRVIRQLDAHGNLSTFDWDASTQTATYTDPRGNKWKDIYSSNVLLDRVDPLGNDTHHQYDTQLNLTATVDPKGNQTTMTYDDRGNLLTKTTPPIGAFSYTKTWTYDTFNNIKTYKNRRGFITTYGYDNAGNLTSVTAPNPGTGAPVTQYGRDPAGTGLLTSITDPRGKTTRYTYSGGNLTSVTTSLGKTTTMSYDASGRMISRVDPRGNVSGADPNQYKTTFTYDDADHLLTKTDPLNHSTTYTFDPAGNPQTVKDANNHSASYGYDEANHLTSVTAPDMTQTVYAYDPDGSLLTRKDANNHITTYGYDAADRLTSITTPAGRNWTYGYDKNGNRIQTVDANANAGTGAAISYTYDTINRLTISSDGTKVTRYSYDPDGNRTSAAVDNGLFSNYQYDALDRVTSVGENGAGITGKAITYTYDVAGNVTERDYPNNVIARYTYDDDERLQAATSATATTTYGYDAAGNVTTTTLPSTNGYVESRTYDRAGRLTEVKTQKGSSVLADVNVTLDPVGNPLSVVRSGSTSLIANYSYDNRDRITEACFQANLCTGGTSPFIRWTYDAVGNRLSEARPNGTTNSAYDQDDRLLSAGATTYSYDANGNETQAGATTFTYDNSNQLTSATTGRTTTTYMYSPEGRRLTASTGSQTAATTQFAWDVVGVIPLLAVEQDGGGALLRSYLYGLNRISMNAGGAAYYYHHDQLGSVINVTSSLGATQWTDSYEPFGTIRTETKNANKAPTNLMKFTGQYLDPTGLYHLRARQYDPTAGRFLTSDPAPSIETAPYVASYAYVADQPTVLIDPTGLCPWYRPDCLISAGSHAVEEGVSEAKDFISDHPITIGACIQGSVTVVHLNVHGGGCVEVSTNGNVGGTATIGGGVSSAALSVSVTVQAQASNARCAADLGGGFAAMSATAGEGVVVTGGDFGGKGTAGQPVGGVQGGVGVGVGPPAEVVSGGNYTFTRNFVGKGCNSK